MCCALALLGILGPRVLIVLWWLVDPLRWGVVFDDQILLPLLGFFLLPWTTVMYVLAWTAGGVDGFGWVLVGLGLVLDIGTYGGGTFGNKDKLPGYSA
jgi:hypothetical protein